jgi:hypothetical protein
MNAISKMLSAALLAGLFAAVQPAVSLACDKDKDTQANEEKKKDDKTVAQRDEDQSKKKGEQVPSDKRQGKGESSNTPRPN